MVLRFIFDAIYKILDQILKGSICEQTSPAEVDCHCAILGSYDLFFLSVFIYFSFFFVPGVPHPWRKSALHIHMSVQELSDMFSTLKVRTYKSHDYGAIAERVGVKRNHTTFWAPFTPAR